MRAFIFLLGHQAAQTVEPHDVYAGLLRDATAAEDLGFDGLWVAEHHFSNYCLVPNPLTLLAAISQRTQRIHIGSAVVVVPLHNPVRVAEEIAMVDQLSHGRVEMMFGRGYQPYESAGLGIPFEESHTRYAEGLDIIADLLAKPNRSHNGEHFSFPQLTVTPPAVQKPNPPLWLACGSPWSIKGALERGMNVAITAGVDGLEKLQGLRQAFEDGCSEYGTDPKDTRFAVQLYTYVSEDEQRRNRAVEAALAVSRAGNQLRHNRQIVEDGFLYDAGRSDEDPDKETVLSSTLIGGKGEISEKVDALREMGISDLFMNFRFGAFQDSEVQASMEVMAELLRLEDVRA